MISPETKAQILLSFKSAASDFASVRENNFPSPHGTTAFAALSEYETFIVSIFMSAASNSNSFCFFPILVSTSLSFLVFCFSVSGSKKSLSFSKTKSRNSEIAFSFFCDKLKIARIFFSVSDIFLPMSVPML